MSADTRAPFARVSTDDPQDALWRAWDHFDVALRQARGRAVHATLDGLTHSQFRLLTALSRTSDVRCVQLAEQLGVTAPTVTRMLTGLEKQGMVERARTVDDRRGVSIRLTAAGREALLAKEAVITAKRQELYDSLTPAERSQAERLFRRLAEQLDVL
ncbi:MAG TPA: MarR family transcriptional regulator [Sporichthyaceae bacterium]|jgi:DNA-binding MarR family transcriptional regulator